MTYTHHDRETYGERRLRLWRSGEHAELTRGERAELVECDAWDAQHADEVARLEALVGARASLRKTHRTWAVDVQDESAARVPREYAKGTRMTVRARMRERLLVSVEDGATLLVRREWLALLAPAPKPEVRAEPAPLAPKPLRAAHATTHPYAAACDCRRCRKLRVRARVLGVPVETLLRAPRRL